MDPNTWHFTGDDASFTLRSPHLTRYLYFPLVNDAGMMSVVTPTLHGDAKSGQNEFLTQPVSVEDLHESRTARNFWAAVEGRAPWSVTGNSSWQAADPSADTVTLEAGLLWHRVTRENASVGLRADVLSFAPAGPDRVELMQVTLSNISSACVTVTPTAAIPIYGRSADNLRDHRHVTSLLHRIRTVTHGVAVRPTLSFDERGHRSNAATYAVLGADQSGAAPVAFFPDLETFAGEAGHLERPAAIFDPAAVGVSAGCDVAGFEAMGALRFAPITLAPGESRAWVIILAILPEGGDDHALDALVAAYGSADHVAGSFERTCALWQARASAVTFRGSDARFDAWLKWVAVQPTLRRLFGNSFLPFHDYGRGGRGWRDLWQDCLALLLLNPVPVPELLFSSFAGVRVDGSNATIIGARPGEFRADRNDIPRVWMDHGAWPYLTTRLYVDQSGDLAFLLREQTYFKDRHADRCRAHDDAWSPEQGTSQMTAEGLTHRGTILEHLLVQHLTAFFNAGPAGNLLLEGADWNDGMDMARRRGESVAFTALYAANLADLSRLVLELARLGATDVALAAELLPLLDTLSEPVEYGDPAARQARLAAYFARCRHTVSGEKRTVPLAALAADLAAKADFLAARIRSREWAQDGAGRGWFNGYYDDDGNPVEGTHARGVRMTLTGQVFTLLGGIATDEQAASIVRAADHYLYDRAVGGYRLNSDLGEVLLNLGRCFGFAYGHKENGAMFSHMAVMYAYALYARGFAAEGWKALSSIYGHCQDFSRAAMYPGLPEYVNSRGRGVYGWLTGSASWYLLTMLTQVYGVRGHLGDLVLAPKLAPEQYDAAGEASVRAQFAGRDLEVVYRCAGRLPPAVSRIETVTLDGAACPFERDGAAVRLPRAVLGGLTEGARHRLLVTLAEAPGASSVLPV